MTRVVVFMRQGRCTGFAVSGHAGYAESGHDIVCAAVSALVQTCELGLRHAIGAEPVVSRDDDAGRYALRLPVGTRPAHMRRAQLLFRTLLLGLESIEAAYPDCVRVKVKERRWN